MINRMASAGSVTKNDCMVTISPSGTDCIEVELTSIVKHQFGDQIEAAKEASPSTVFLSAGMNDVIETGGDTEAFLTEFGEVLSQIRTELPGVNIFVNSILPVQQKAIDEEPLLEQIPAYNEALRTFCSSQGIGYVDNTEIVQESYYGGDGIHFTSAFYPVWAEHMAEVAAL